MERAVWIQVSRNSGEGGSLRVGSSASRPRNSGWAAIDSSQCS